MAGFGVTQVQTPAGYEHTDVPGLDASIEFISLNGALAPGKRQGSGERR